MLGPESQYKYPSLEYKMTPIHVLCYLQDFKTLDKLLSYYI